MSSKIKSGKVAFDLKRFAGIKRDYTKEEVERTIQVLSSI